MSNSLPASSKNVITLNTLVQGCREMVDSLAKSDGITPEAYLKDLGRAVEEVAEVWEEVIDPFEDKWSDVLDIHERPVTFATSIYSRTA